MQANEIDLMPTEEDKGMTNSELNSFLEVIAKLIEAKATTVEDAAQIVRQAKV